MSAALIQIPLSLADCIQSISLDHHPTNSAHTAYSVLPGLCPVMGFQFRGALAIQRSTQADRLAPAGISGLQSESRRFFPIAPAASVLVRFTPFGAYALLGCPMSELANRQVALRDLSRDAAELEAQLADASTAAVATNLVCNWLLALQHRRPRQPHADLVQAVARITAGNGGVSVERIADQLCIGRRQLERLFEQQIGIGPKQFASLTRFTWTLRHMGAHRSWAALADAAGYADQAHFINSFKRRTGLTPQQYQQSLRPPQT